MKTFLLLLDPALYPFLLIPALLLLFCILSCLLGGWLQLLGRFRRTSGPVGMTHSVMDGRWDTISMRWWTSIPTLHLAAAEDALYLSVWFPFSIFCPALRIPWSEIDISTCSWNLRDYVVLTLGREEQIPLRISESVARKLCLQPRLPKGITLPPEPNFDTLDEDFVKSLERKSH